MHAESVCGCGGNRLATSPECRVNSLSFSSSSVPGVAEMASAGTLHQRSRAANVVPRAWAQVASCFPTPMALKHFLESPPSSAKQSHKFLRISGSNRATKKQTYSHVLPMQLEITSKGQRSFTMTGATVKLPVSSCACECVRCASPANICNQWTVL